MKLVYTYLQKKRGKVPTEGREEGEGATEGRGGAEVDAGGVFGRSGPLEAG